jgi:hypothetical protein
LLAGIHPGHVPKPGQSSSYPLVPNHPPHAVQPGAALAEQYQHEYSECLCFRFSSQRRFVSNMTAMALRIPSSHRKISAKVANSQPDLLNIRYTSLQPRFKRQSYLDEHREVAALPKFL